MQKYYRLYRFVVLFFCLHVYAYSANFDPIIGEDTTKFTYIESPFGSRNAGIDDATAFHRGIDFEAIKGTEAYYVMDGSNRVYIKQISYPPKTIKSSTAGYVLELGDYKYLHLKAHTVNDFFGVFPIHYKDTSGTWHILNAQKDGVVIGYEMALKVSDTKCKVICAPNHEIFVKNMRVDEIGFFNELKLKFPLITDVSISTYIEPSTKEGRLIALTGDTKNDEADPWPEHLHIAKGYSNPLTIIPHVDWIAPTITINYPLNGSLVQAGVDMTFDVHVDDDTSRNLNNIKFSLKKGTSTKTIMEWSFDPESPSDLKKMI